MTHRFAVEYAIKPANPAAHLYEVTCVVVAPSPDGQIVSLPAWIPGSYMIRDFAKNIVRISATDERGPVTLRKLDKQTWQSGPCVGALTISYEVYAWDLSVRSAHLDQSHAYFNGTSVFLRVHGADEKACKVELLRPDGEEYRPWRVATALRTLDAQMYGFGSYLADNYDELIDHPVEIGAFTLVTFDACGVPHDIAITGVHDADMDRLCADLKKVCEHHIRFFGEPAPMDRYVFQVMAVGEGYGGLEHRASTSLICSRFDLPRKGDKDMSDGYRTFLGLCSHEYFHTWNVKRVKPAAFVPYDLSKESHTRLLWWFEGITSYFDDLGLVRSGVITQASYLELLGQTITKVIRGKGRFKQSVTNSSFDAWTKFYKQDESAPNNIVSYYTKGSIVALALDLKIRNATNDGRSLDDVMLYLWNCYRETGRGVDEYEIEKIVGELIGADLAEFLDKALRSTDDLPLAELLNEVGIEYHTRKASGQNDLGGKPANGKTVYTAFDFGIRFTNSNGAVGVVNVFDDTAAQRAGLSGGDVLIAINQLKVTPDSLDKALGRSNVGDIIQLHAFRRDELKTFTATLTDPEKTTCYLVMKEEKEYAEKRKKWLSV